MSGMLHILYTIFLEMYTEHQKLGPMPEIQYLVMKIWILLTQFSSSEIMPLGDTGYTFLIILHIYLTIFTLKSILIYIYSEIHTHIHIYMERETDTYRYCKLKNVSHHLTLQGLGHQPLQYSYFNDKILQIQCLASSHTQKSTKIFHRDMRSSRLLATFL